MPHRTPGLRSGDAAGENVSHARGEAVGGSSVLSPPSAFTAVGVRTPTARDIGVQGAGCLQSWSRSAAQNAIHQYRSSPPASSRRALHDQTAISPPASPAERAGIFPP